MAWIGGNLIMRIYKRLAMLLSMGIMGIGLITFQFDPTPAALDEPNISKQASDMAVTSIPTPTPSPTPEPTPTPVPNNLEQITDGEIYDLVVNYCKAKLKCSREAFEGIVTDASYISEDELQFRYATVLDFDDFKCYSKRGSGIIDYIVYCTYRMDIATVETKGIAIDRVFITKQDGSPKVFFGYLDDSTQAELEKLYTDDDIQVLLGETAEELQAEMESDPDFQAYMMRLYLGSDLDPDSEELPEESPSDDVSEDTLPNGDVPETQDGTNAE